MTEAEATVRFCILTGIAQTPIVEEQVEAILEHLFHREGTSWAVREYLKEIEGRQANERDDPDLRI